jgi:hypothetical protein
VNLQYYEKAGIFAPLDNTQKFAKKIKQYLIQMKNYIEYIRYFMKKLFTGNKNPLPKLKHVQRI